MGESIFINALLSTFNKYNQITKHWIGVANKFMEVEPLKNIEYIELRHKIFEFRLFEIKSEGMEQSLTYLCSTKEELKELEYEYASEIEFEFEALKTEMLKCKEKREEINKHLNDIRIVLKEVDDLQILIAAHLREFQEIALSAAKIHVSVENSRYTTKEEINALLSAHTHFCMEKKRALLKIEEIEGIEKQILKLLNSKQLSSERKNKYTTYTFIQLKLDWAELKDLEKTRTDVMRKQVNLYKVIDSQCMMFAKEINAFYKEIGDELELINIAKTTDGGGSAETERATINSDFEDKIEMLVKMKTALDIMGIIENPYTKLTMKNLLAKNKEYLDAFNQLAATSRKPTGNGHKQKKITGAKPKQRKHNRCN